MALRTVRDALTAKVSDTLGDDLRGTLRSEVSDNLTAEVSNESCRGSLTS